MTLNASLSRCGLLCSSSSSRLCANCVSSLSHVAACFCSDSQSVSSQQTVSLVVFLCIVQSVVSRQISCLSTAS